MPDNLTKCRSLTEINLLGLLHQTLLVEDNQVRTNVLDTLYVLMNRSVIPAQDEQFISMRREAFSEQSLQGYNQVLDHVFANMISQTGHVGIDREGYGVGKKFVMVLPTKKPPKLHQADNSTFVPLQQQNYFPCTANPFQRLTPFYFYFCDSAQRLRYG